MQSKNRTKVIIKGLIGIVIAASFVIIILIIQKLELKRQIVDSYSQLPSLELKGIDGTVISLEKEFKDEKVILIVYSSECGYCSDQINRIMENSFKFSNTNIVLTTMEERERVFKISAQYSQKSGSNVTWTYTDNVNTIKWLANFKVPSIFIYNADHQLVKFFEGVTSVSEIQMSIDISDN